MSTRIKVSIVVLAVFSLACGGLFAQTTATQNVVVTASAVAGIALADGSQMNLTGLAVTTPGLAAAGATGTDELFYTVAGSAGTGTIIAARLSIEALNGTTLSIAVTDTGEGASITGVAPGLVLNAVDQTIIDTIPNCATGIVAGDGAAVTITVGGAGVSGTATIQYTITAS